VFIEFTLFVEFTEIIVLIEYELGRTENGGGDK